MTSFQDIPNELLYEMCENWSLDTLLNMSEAYSRVYQLCKNIINQRKKDYLRIKSIQSFLDEASKRKYFHKIEPYNELSRKKIRMSMPSSILAISNIILPIHKIFGKREDLEYYLSIIGYTPSEIEDIFNYEGVNSTNYDIIGKKILPRFIEFN